MNWKSNNIKTGLLLRTMMCGAAAAMLWLGACTRDKGLDIAGGTGAGHTVELELEITADASVQVTRSSDDMSGGRISEIWAAAFNDDTGTVVGMRSFDDGFNASTDHGNPTSDRITIPVLIKDGATTRIRAVAVANYAGIKGWMGDKEGDLADLLPSVTSWDDLMTLAIDTESARAAENTIMSNIITDGTAHGNNMVDVATGKIYHNGSENASAIFSLNGSESNNTPLKGRAHLRRMISEITVNIQTGENISLEDVEVNFYNVPGASYVIDRTAIAAADIDADTWAELSPNADDRYTGGNFTEGKAEAVISGEYPYSFRYCHYDNKHLGVDGMTEYLDREKKFDGTDVYSSLCPDADNALNNTAGYFVISATVKDSGKANTSARINYIVHEGFCNDAFGAGSAKNLADFSCFRNTKYNYKVTINGLNSILVDVYPTDGSARPDITVDENSTIYGIPTILVDEEGKTTEDFTIWLTDEQKSELKWRIIDPSIDADYGTFDGTEDMSAYEPFGWPSLDNMEQFTAANADDEFFKAIKFNTESLADFAPATRADVKEGKTAYTVTAECEYSMPVTGDINKLARYFYCYAPTPYEGDNGIKYQPMFCLKQMPKDSREPLTVSMTLDKSTFLLGLDELKLNVTDLKTQTDADPRYTIAVNNIVIIEDENVTEFVVTSEYFAKGTNNITVSVRDVNELYQPLNGYTQSFTVSTSARTWDFGKTPWTTVGAPIDGTDTPDWSSGDADPYLTVFAKGDKKIQYKTANQCFQPGAFSDMDNMAGFVFKAYTSGKVVVNVTTTGSRDDTADRFITVQTGEDPENTESQVGGYTSADAKKHDCTFNINIENGQPQNIYIYPTGAGALRVYSVVFTPNN